MTTRELNRDIKRLNTFIKGIKQAAEMMQDNTAYFRDIEGYAKNEFTRLLGADKTLESLSAESLRIMLKLNLSHRFVPLHTFGIFIQI